MAVTSMVLGIVSLFSWCLPPLAMLLGVLAIIFGFLGLKQSVGMSVTGMLCGSAHFLFWILVFSGLFAAGSAVSPR